jgi:DNA repair protein RecN (Recombination protein N)
LHVENLAVIERATILFGDGLTAVTGESGSGKTMLVNALDLLLGGRADSGAVRRGAAEARIDARFEREDADGALIETVVSRVIPADGRSRAYLDGRPTTTSALAEVTGRLLDLHGQHEQHRLGSMAWRRALLDAHGGIDTVTLDAIRAESVAIDAEIAALGGSGTERAREVDLLSYQIDEIDSLEIEGPDEDETLRELIARLGAVDEIRRRGAAALSRLTDDDAMADALRDLDGLPGLGELHDRLADLVEGRRDLAATLRRTLDGVDSDPERLDQANRRYAALTDLKRKYGDDLTEVLRFRDEAAERRDLLESHEERLVALTQRQAARLEAHRLECRRVRGEREAAAVALGGLITDEARSLGMEHAQILVTVDGEDGSGVEFLFTSGPGDQPRPVQRVASGGEAARCMLAIDLVRSRIDDPGDGPSASGTVVFDEVDAGLGGVAGGSVAAALRELSRTHQVIAVTHLAAVASVSDQQIRVSKALVGGVATSTAVHVDGDERVDEVARMFAGNVDESAREHARGLLRQASPSRPRGSG